MRQEPQLPGTTLLREAFRHNGKACKRTIPNLSKWPDEHVQGLRALLLGGSVVPHLANTFAIQRSLPHRFVAAVLWTLVRTGLAALIVARLRATLSISLGHASVSKDDLDRAMDWLLARQAVIETCLARCHLTEGCLVQAASTPSYVEDRCCLRATRGQSCEGRNG